MDTPQRTDRSQGLPAGPDAVRALVLALVLVLGGVPAATAAGGVVVEEAVAAAGSTVVGLRRRQLSRRPDGLRRRRRSRGVARPAAHLAPARRPALLAPPGRGPPAG